MRLTLTFLRRDSHALLPLNYQYEIGAWIYRTLDLADRSFTRRLHEGDCIRGFTFSNLRLEKFTLMPASDCLRIDGETISLSIGFSDPSAALLFCQGLEIRPELHLSSPCGEISFELTQIEQEALPRFQTRMRYRTISPLNITQKQVVNGRLRQHYVSPEEVGYGQAFVESLCRKHHQLTGISLDPSLVQFRLLSVPKSRLITIRAGKPQQTRVRGYMFEFELSAPPSLHRTGFLAGFGEKSSMGFGCTSIAEPPKQRISLVRPSSSFWKV